MSESIGNEIQTKRSALGMSQARLAELVGRSTSTVRSWERGKTSPSPSSLDALKAVLGLEGYDNETVMEMPAVVRGVAPDGFVPEPVLEIERDPTLEHLSLAEEVSATEDLIADAEDLADEVVEDLQVDEAPEEYQDQVEPDPYNGAPPAPAYAATSAAPVAVTVQPVVVGVPEATVSFVDKPSGVIRYFGRIVATLVVLGGLLIVGKWAAGGFVEILKGVFTSVKVALGF